MNQYNWIFKKHTENYGLTKRQTSSCHYVLLEKICGFNARKILIF